MTSMVTFWMMGTPILRKLLRDDRRRDGQRPSDALQMRPLKNTTGSLGTARPPFWRSWISYFIDMLFIHSWSCNGKNDSRSLHSGDFSPIYEFVRFQRRSWFGADESQKLFLCKNPTANPQWAQWASQPLATLPTPQTLNLTAPEHA